jgi:methylmalonyl-CoA mutase N-terminal domain/subunit
MLDVAFEARQIKQSITEKGLSGLIPKSTSGVKLYNLEALNEIADHLKSWFQKSGYADFESPSYTMLGVKDKLRRPLFATPLNVKDLVYIEDIGFPGEEPYTRGLHHTMYRGKKITIRPIVGFGTPEDTNKRIQFLLKSGATGINIVFDLPTIQEYDSDHPFASGQVGLCGVAIDSVEDMKALFRDVPLNELSISLTTHYPSNTMILMSMYIVAAEEMGISLGELRGTVQNCPIMETVVRTSPESLPPKAVYKLHVDNVEFLRKAVPKWNYVTYNGYNLREAGVDEFTEIAVAFANAIETSLQLMSRGHKPDDFLDRMAFFWGIGNDLFLEAARMRAARRLWYKITRHVLGAQSPRSWWCRFHVQTSGISLTREEPLNNVVRSTLHALAGILGGAQSMHVSCYDEAYSIPTEAAHLLSLRTQQIILEETGVSNVVDPLAGSFYVEWLTNESEKGILAELDKLLRGGGIISAIEEGVLHRMIAEFSYKEQYMIQDGVIKVVGVNCYGSDAKVPEIDVFRYPPDAEERQRKKLEKLRKERDNETVADRLDAIKEAAKREENLFPYVLEAVRERATEGEVYSVLKSIYGVWKPSVRI